MKEFLSREGDKHCSILMKRILDCFKSSEWVVRTIFYSGISLRKQLSEKIARFSTQKIDPATGVRKPGKRLARKHSRSSYHLYVWFYDCCFKVGLGIFRTNADSQWNPVYNAFHRNFVVETKRFVSSFVNVILTRQTCGQRSNRAAESQRRALEMIFPSEFANIKM